MIQNLLLFIENNKLIYILCVNDIYEMYVFISFMLYVVDMLISFILILYHEVKIKINSIVFP